MGCCSCVKTTVDDVAMCVLDGVIIVGVRDRVGPSCLSLPNASDNYEQDEWNKDLDCKAASIPGLQLGLDIHRGVVSDDSPRSECQIARSSTKRARTNVNMVMALLTSVHATHCF